MNIRPIAGLNILPTLSKQDKSGFIVDRDRASQETAPTKVGLELSKHHDTIERIEGVIDEIKDLNKGLESNTILAGLKS